jgi:branched-chain amino acid transport system ATP-binding protein
MLKIDRISVYYNLARALYDVSLEVSEGEIVSLIGSNGAGKTTTLNTIVGLKQPADGDVILDRESIGGLPPQEIVKKGIALIPEGRRVFPFMTVFENLMMGAYLLKDRRLINDSFSDLYARFPILRKRHKQLAGSLSGGEQQMLAIARALMGKPKMLLMDEPSLGLSPLLVLSIAKAINEINRSGITILLVEQNARLALDLANRGYVLQNGSVVLQGNTENLINDELVRKVYLGG